MTITGNGTTQTGGSGDLAIDLHDVAKVFRGKIHALRGIEMVVHPGEVFGLLGPNGAGKSTLVKIMMTVIRPSRARGFMLGKPIGHKPTLARVGYLPEHHQLPKYLTGNQVLQYIGALTHVPRRDRRRRAAQLLETVNMSKWANKKVGTYSKGMQQRIGLAQALINEPDLIVLDEPTDGVDPVGRRDIRDVLIELKERGRTIFINSHLLSELEMVCDRVSILVHGRVAMQGTIDDLTANSRRYEICFQGPPPDWATSDASYEVSSRSDESVMVLQGVDPIPVQQVIDRLRNAERTITSIRPVRETLEDLFMRAIQGEQS